MVSEDAGRPASSQPCAIAPPIFPAPTRTRRAGHWVIFHSRQRWGRWGNIYRDCRIFASVGSFRQTTSQLGLGLNRRGSLKGLWRNLDETSGRRSRFCERPAALPLGNFHETVEFYGKKFVSGGVDGAAMKTKVVIVGLVLALAGLAGGCTPVIQSGLPDPQLSARDKQMMALAEPDEWKIPTYPQHRPVFDPGEAGHHHRQYRHQLSLLHPAPWRGGPIPDRQRRRIYGMDRPRRGRRDEGMADLDADRFDHGALAAVPGLQAARAARRPMGQSAWRARALSLRRTTRTR